MLNTYIDSFTRGNVARFVNHSCDPNLSLRILRTHYSIPQAGLFALRDIAAGEELSFNYGTTIGAKGEDKSIGKSKLECKCGAKNCAGYVPTLRMMPLS